MIRALAVAELLSGLDGSRMAELLMMIDQVGQTRQQPPQKWNKYGRLSTRFVVVLVLHQYRHDKLKCVLVDFMSVVTWQ